MVPPMSWVSLSLLGCAGLLLAAAAPAADRLSPARHEVRAQLVPVRHTTLSAELNARVVALPVPESGRFAAGDLLVELDASLPATHVERAQAELRSARAHLSAHEELHRLNAVGALELEQARAAVQRAEAELAGAAVLLARTRIYAPYPGRVAERHVRELQYVQPGQALLDILDDSVLELEFIVPSTWLSQLEPGHALVVQLDETGQDYPAVLSRLGARVDPVSQTVKAVGHISGRHPELVAGMSGRLRPLQRDVAP
jgi:membrane fusion protein, multidrug efflux system